MALWVALRVAAAANGTMTPENMTCSEIVNEFEGHERCDLVSSVGEVHWRLLFRSKGVNL